MQGHRLSRHMSVARRINTGNIILACTQVQQGNTVTRRVNTSSSICKPRSMVSLGKEIPMDPTFRPTISTKHLRSTSLWRKNPCDCQQSDSQNITFFYCDFFLPPLATSNHIPAGIQEEIVSSTPHGPTHGQYVPLLDRFISTNLPCRIDSLGALDFPHLSSLQLGRLW